MFLVKSKYERMIVMLKRTVTVLMCCALIISCIGCGKKESSGGKVSIRVGGWPADTATDAVKEKYQSRLEAMKKAYPDIEVIPDTTGVDVKTFAVKASSNQLPDLYQSHFTEITKNVLSGYAKDLTPYMKKNGYAKNLNPALTDLVSFENKIWAIPVAANVLGLSCNVELFRQAGLLDEKGVPIFPKTYDELTETAVKIKEKTGKSGMVICTTNGQGGWYFTMLANGFGVKFITKDGDKYKASFNSPECIAALEYIRDLKWKYNVLPENSFMDRVEQRKLIATKQAAMSFDTPPVDPYITKYGMNKDDVSFARVPAGKNGRVALLGGQVYMMDADVTDEQIDAIFKWIDISGEGPNVSEEAKKSLDENYAALNKDGLIVTGRNLLDIWVNDELVKAQTELRAKYTNVDDNKFADYYGFEDVAIKLEEYPCAQQLYQVLDAGLQEIMTNKNCDIKKLVKEMNNNFQVNHLDKWEG